MHINLLFCRLWIVNQIYDRHNYESFFINESLDFKSAIFALLNMPSIQVIENLDAESILPL